MKEVNTTEIKSQTFKFELSLDEANLILAALQELPHKLVNTLIQKILEQAKEQTPSN